MEKFEKNLLGIASLIPGINFASVVLLKIKELDINSQIAI